MGAEPKPPRLVRRVCHAEVARACADCAKAHRTIYEQALDRHLAVARFALRLGDCSSSMTGTPVERDSSQREASWPRSGATVAVASSSTPLTDSVWFVQGVMRNEPKRPGSGTGNLMSW